jgi:glycosyltransferase involved in cell wall biosynthesis
MKILYHHRVASKDGQYVHIEEIISSLRKLGHEVIVCEPRSIQSTQFGGGSKMVQRVRAIMPGFAHELVEFLYSFLDYFKLRSLIKRTRPDVIYERYNLYFVSGIWASKRFKLPILMEVNAPLFSERSLNGGISMRWLARWSEDYTWKNAHYVLPVTEVLAQMVEKRGIPRQRLRVIPNGINRNFCSRLPDADAAIEKLGLKGKLVLDFTGFVRDWHRLDRVLQVIADHPEKNWHFLLVGDGPDRPRLQALAASLEVQDRFMVTGIVSREEMPGLVQCFDIALQPDVVPYASPLKMFEYMALGKPILAPATPNIREILRDGENALLFEQSDQSFGRQLLRLCESEELRNRLGEAARASIEKNSLYWDTNAERIVELFKIHETVEAVPLSFQMKRYSE